MHFLFKGLFDVSEYAGRSSKKVTVMKAEKSPTQRLAGEPRARDEVCELVMFVYDWLLSLKQVRVHEIMMFISCDARMQPTATGVRELHAR